MTKREEFVVFESPGTLFSESTSRPIARRDPALALRMSSEIVERHGARPYAFRFETRITADPVPDGEGGTLRVEPRTVDQSGRYFIGGRVESFSEVEARCDPAEDILRGNMRGNGMWFVWRSTSGHRSTMEFGERDVTVDAAGEIVERGDSASREAYRKRKTEERDAAYARLA